MEGGHRVHQLASKTRCQAAVLTHFAGLGVEEMHAAIVMTAVAKVLDESPGRPSVWQAFQDIAIILSKLARDRKPAFNADAKPREPGVKRGRLGHPLFVHECTRMSGCPEFTIGSTSTSALAARLWTCWLGHRLI
jgi:hypothetical protein